MNFARNVRRLGPFALCAGAVIASSRLPAGEISYQGRLDLAGSPASGEHDLRFQLYDAAQGGNAVDTPICRDQILVADGLFDTMLDFGAAPFDGAGLWLEIGVRADAVGGNCDAGVYTVLSPRQSLASAPYAISAESLQVPLDLSADLELAPLVRLVNSSVLGTALRVETTHPGGVANYTFSSQTAGLGGRAVLGLATDTQGGGAANYGVWGQAAGPSGHGLYGFATHPSGLNYGVRGKTQSPAGWAGYFEGRGYFSGRLAIGTTSPAHPLHVQGSDQFMQRIVSSNANGTWLDLQNTTTGGNVWSILSTGSGNGEGAGDLVIRVPTALALDIDTNGFVGFGDNSPTFRIELPNSADNSGRGRANAWTTYSSRRWKHNIATLDGALDTLLRLRGVRFDWNAEHGGAADIGFVAEEVGAVLPELVTWEENKIDAASLAYDRITAVTVEAIKQQQRHIAELERELDAMRVDMMSLRQAIMKPAGAPRGDLNGAEGGVR